MNIGIFDSGVGGLSVLKKLSERLPSYNYIYCGDNKHVPYGEKRRDEIYELTKKAVTFLFEQQCQIIILACNTATAAALRRLQQTYLPLYYPNRRILGVILPICEEVTKRNLKRVGVIATTSTVRSNSFVIELQKLQPSLKIYQNECPLLVPFIEKGNIGIQQIDKLLHTYLQPLIEKRIEALLLGCTHYGFVQDKIQKLVGPSIEVVSENETTVQKFEDYLNRHPEIEMKLDKQHKRLFYVTKLDPEYKNHMQFFLGKPADTVYLIP